MPPSPKNRYVSFPCSGVLSEHLTPLQVGGSGLTAVNNLIYHRQGSWGKRCGANAVVLPVGTNPALLGNPVSGYRWYRAFPSPVTRLVVYAQGVLSIGTTPSALSPIGTFALSGQTAPSFCSAYDPQANSGNGADVLIIAGLVQPGGATTGSPATGSITISGLPGVNPNGGYITVTIAQGSNTVTTAQYYVLGTDNPGSIASNIVQLINNTAAYLNQVPTVSYTPFINEAYFTENTLPYGATDSNGQPQSGSSAANWPKATIHFGALLGGSQGNSIQINATMTGTMGTGSTLAVSPTSPTNLTNGGNSWSGPLLFDRSNNTLRALSYMAPNAFTQCVSWHNHVALWGDPNNPTTLFLSDINQPEAFTFMEENGGMDPSGTNPNNGGYDIGRGDGDPVIQTCIPIGNALYIFKTANIYMMEGYDFQVGEYQFSVTPQVSGYGVPNPYCASVMENELVFWSGRKMLRLAPGSYEPEHIGLPIPNTEGTISQGNQSLARVIAGDFQVQTELNNHFGVTIPFESSTIMYRSLFITSFDPGDGTPDVQAVYDDETTNTLGAYAWTLWSGWNVGCWILQGNGPSISGNSIDPPTLYWIDSAGINIYNVGSNPTQDPFGAAIPWMAQTGFIDFGTPQLIDNARIMFANVEATPGASLAATLIPGRIVPAQPSQIVPYGIQPQTVSFNPTLAPGTGESNNDMQQYIFNPNLAGAQPIQATSLVVQFNESGASFAGFELLSYGFDIKPEEAFAT